MSRFRNSSAYKHAIGSFYKREQWYSDLRPCTSASDAQGIAASLNHIAFVLESGNAVGVIKEGNYAKREPFKIHAHSAQIYDLQFAPYNDNLLATGADDGRLRIWDIPESGLTADLSNSKIDLNGHRKRVSAIRFHPVADNVLASGGNDSKVLIWDVQVGAPAFNFDVDDNVQGLSWNYDGSLLALTTAAKTVSVWDPRNQIRVQSGAGHQGVKATRAVWLGASNYFATTGFGRSRERQVSIWDYRDLSKAVATNTLDTSTGILEALYDNDTSLLYIGGKGDGNIRTYEIKDSSPFFTEITPFVSDVPTKSLCLAPKRSVDVMNCEVNRLYKLTNNAVAPIAWTVPRKSKINFAADLFPHTIGSTPAVSAVDWANGTNAQPILIDLDPSNFGLTVVQKEEIKQQEAEQKAATEAAEKAKKNELPKLNIVRSSKFRHVAGKFAQRSQFFENVKADNSSSDSESIKANKKYIAVPWSGAGGNIAILSLNKPIRVPDTPGLIECGSNQLDMDFHPFNDDIIVTGLENAKIKIWQIPENLISQKQNFRTESASLSGHYSKVTLTQFNPVASNVLASASYDFTIKLWDIEKASAVQTVSDPNDLTQCLAWNYDGSLIATTNRDKRIRIVDPRRGSVVAAADAHPGAKASKVTWMGSQNKIISVGFSKNSERQFSVWDARNLVDPLGTVLIDSSSGVITPYYDEGTGILFTLGKGDATIPYYEIVDEAPYGHFLSKFQAPDPAVGVAVLPTRLNNVAEVEFVSMLKLTTQRIQPLTFTVPRTRKEFFQDDIFPPARSGQPALSANDWFAGRNANPPLISLKPAGMINLSEAPAIEREKKYDFAEEQLKRSTGAISKEQVMDSFFAKVSGDWKEAEVVVPVGATYDHRNKEVDEDEWSD